MGSTKLSFVYILLIAHYLAAPSCGHVLHQAEPQIPQGKIGFVPHIFSQNEKFNKKQWFRLSECIFAMHNFFGTSCT